jgi:2'-5' RNA ligase
MDFTRAFIAVNIGEPARSVIKRLIENLQSKVDHIRWTRDDQLHLTVKFLGDVDNRELPQICNNLRDQCQFVEPFIVSLVGLGTFPSGRPPRIIWASIEEGLQQLSDLHQRLDASLADLGLPREGRRYTPHLTLGRVRRGAAIPELQDVLSKFQGAARTQFDVDEVILMASLRERGKSLYEPIDVVEL